jgi:NAD(P)-dependent dehydrogenase (short-subunit alcohol dehydrogenase family)
MMQNNVNAMPPDEARALISGYSSMTAAGRIGRLDEVEGLIQFLASNAGSYMNGSTISLDGGMHITMRPNVSIANSLLSVES